MKYVIPAAFALMGTLVLCAPASAQIVNGQGGMTPTAEAPIGTKAGGSSASMQAPGEGAAVKGAMDNNAQAKNLGATSSTTRRHKKSMSNSTTTSDH